MSCSKLFSGDSPEISTFIIQNLRYNINTLYFLSLVNRFWCRLAIPLLWEDPFSIKCQNLTFHFLDTYFLSLNDNDKNEIKAYKFDSNLNSRKPLFNYPSLIKTLNFFRLELHVTRWLNSTIPIQKSHFTLIYSRMEPFETLDYTINGKFKDIYIALFKIFIENNASLNNLYINTRFSGFDFVDMVLDNPKFISEIKRLSI